MIEDWGNPVQSTGAVLRVSLKRPPRGQVWARYSPVLFQELHVPAESVTTAPWNEESPTARDEARIRSDFLLAVMKDVDRSLGHLYQRGVGAVLADDGRWRAVPPDAMRFF